MLTWKYYRGHFKYCSICWSRKSSIPKGYILKILLIKTICIVKNHAPLHTRINWLIYSILRCKHCITNPFKIRIYVLHNCNLIFFFSSQALYLLTDVLHSNNIYISWAYIMVFKQIFFHFGSCPCWFFWETP